MSDRAQDVVRAAAEHAFVGERPSYTLRQWFPDGSSAEVAMADPFHTTFIRPAGIRGRLRWAFASLLGRGIRLTLDAPPEWVEAVCLLDPEYLGKHGGERRAAWDERVRGALARSAASEPGEAS